MEQRTYRGEITPDGLADALVARFNSGPLMAQRAGDEEHLMVQIATRNWEGRGSQAALSVGISLNQIWVIVWFAAGIVALVTGIMWGARSDVSFALEIVALKALPVLILGGFTSIPGAIIGGLIIGISEKLAEFYWGPMVGGSIESWVPFFVALIFLWFRPQGLFGEKIIERV